MYAVTTKPEQDDQALQSVGTMIEADSEGLLVRTDLGVLRARRALSCLVEPEPSDRVLVAGRSAEDLFVIAVLERPEPSPVRITLDGDCAVGLREGRFSVVAAHGIDLASASEMTVSASELDVRAASGRVFLEQMSYLGRRIFCQAEKIRLVGSLFEAVMERISQKVKCSYRIVDEVDHLRSRQIDYRASANVDLRGKNTLVTAEELVKMDGDQIHLG